MGLEINPLHRNAFDDNLDSDSDYGPTRNRRRGPRDKLNPYQRKMQKKRVEECRGVEGEDECGGGSAGVRIGGGSGTSESESGGGSVGVGIGGGSAGDGTGVGIGGGSAGDGRLGREGSGVGLGGGREGSGVDLGGGREGVGVGSGGGGSATSSSLSRVIKRVSERVLGRGEKMLTDGDCD
ncbi:uncharacterized protein LOC130589762 [Beta vulgaris subsp. vulgaris]|uniref:uncharacterized protein LOC130589762 n=1 Tax=Beta vulgaris subsp. vulgaris TaxID=3555 RepID=UPI002546594F|nr:uncharacterized protein LOC130589762 [Beta vulgaris subsp. vulgaris]